MMESIEKLRDELQICETTGSRPTIAFVAQCADEIEAEIESRYMLLPLDRKGEPWRIGDKFAFAGASGDKHICTVSGIGDGEVFFYYDEHSDSTKHRHFRAAALVHHKPRTVEDVLRDLVDGIGSVEFDALTAIGEAAEEIRELMEVGR